jgi:hypothetical protein
VYKSTAGETDNTTNNREPFETRRRLPKLVMMNWDGTLLKTSWEMGDSIYKLSDSGRAPGALGGLAVDLGPSSPSSPSTISEDLSTSKTTSQTMSPPRHISFPVLLDSVPLPGRNLEPGESP